MVFFLGPGGVVGIVAVVSVVTSAHRLAPPPDWRYTSCLWYAGRCGSGPATGNSQFQRVRAVRDASSKTFSFLYFLLTPRVSISTCFSSFTFFLSASLPGGLNLYTYLRPPLLVGVVWRIDRPFPNMNGWSGRSSFVADSRRLSDLWLGLILDRRGTCV